MKKSIILFIFFTSLTFSQVKDCGIVDLQVAVYNYTKVNLLEISKDLDKNSAIELNIKIVAKQIVKISYKVVFIDDDYLQDFTINSGLNKFIVNTLRIKLNQPLSCDYESIIFSIPMSLENINIAMKEIN